MIVRKARMIAVGVDSSFVLRGDKALYQKADASFRWELSVPVRMC